MKILIYLSRVNEIYRHLKYPPERKQAFSLETLLRENAKNFAVGVVIISAMLMAYIIYEITTAKQQFADQLIAKSISQTESELDGFFDRINHLIHAAGDQYESGFWDGLSTEKLILHSVSIIENYPPISSVGVADRRGYELNIIPDSTAGRWLTREIFVDRWGRTARWKRWGQGRPVEMIEEWEAPLPVDTRDRPWFRGAIRADGEIFWTSPYLYTTERRLGITASMLVDNAGETGSPSATPSKIVAFDLTLEDLNDFVGDLELTSNQNLFLLDGSSEKVLALHNYNPDLGPAEVDSLLLISPAQLGNPTLLNVLNNDDNRQAFRFEAGGRPWWGILRPYPVTESLTINIVSVLPEEDFAGEINQTMWVSVGSFFLMLALSLLVVWNHNKLHRISNVFSQKNKLISDQKRVLLAEVHHRVKNNLALISAFLELDLMQVTEPAAEKHLGRNRRRIKVIAIVQEEAYRSEVVGRVPVESLISEIANSLQGSEAETGLVRASPGLDINVNQALSYGLLVNEVLEGLIRRDNSPAVEGVTIDITRRESRVQTVIAITQEAVPDGFDTNYLSTDVFEAFLRQLDAEIETDTEAGLAFTIGFTLKDQKGIVSSTTIRA